MSGGRACRIPEHRADWFVSALRSNTSAFNGYVRAPSRFSEVRCPHPHPLDGTGGDRVWRTSARYVDDLPVRTYDRGRWVARS